MKTECTNCHQQYDVDGQYLGQEVQCQQCGQTFIIRSIDDVHKVASNKRVKEILLEKYCNKCGTKLDAGVRFCTNCGHQQGTIVLTENNGGDAGISWKDKLSRVAGVEKLEEFSLSALFSDVFSKHSQEEIEDYFTVGTTRTTPSLDEVDTSWPRPWVFFRMFITSIVVYFLFWFSYKEFENLFLVPGLIVMGSFAVPFSTLIFFMEVNVVRNVSMYQVNKSLCVGGIISLIVSLFLYRWTDSLGALLGPSVAGIVEEVGKLLTVIFLAANNKRYTYKLNGLLLGAAVGTGFAIFETAGYALAAGLKDVDDMGSVLVLRGLLSPFAHVVWTAIAVAALWRVKESSKFDFGILGNPKFLRLFAVPVVLHMIWNSPLQLPFCGTAIILGIVAWIIVLSLVQEGLREVRETKTRKASIN